MILRLWSSRYRADAADEFEELVRDKLFPKFREHGCLSFYSAADRTKNPPEMVVVSLWENMEAIEKMGGGASDRKVIESDRIGSVHRGRTGHPAFPGFLRKVSKE